MKHKQPEAPKRLTPSKDTLRELYLKSGNRCAFPGCHKALFNAKGYFVGQICHIEAAESGGERFNPTQSNEQRRHVSNLLMMCYDHHIETNNVGAYSVESMQRIKAEHERMFSDVVNKMLAQVVDHTTLSKPVAPKSLARLSKALGWDDDKDVIRDARRDLLKLARRLSHIPKPSREFLCILIKRGGEASFGGFTVSIAEVKMATGLSSQKMREHFSILHKNFTYDAGENEFGIPIAGIRDVNPDWPIWVDLKNFCKRAKIDLGSIVVNLDFSVLD